MKYFIILFGLLILVGFTGITFATHDPNQPQIHSIILPPDMKEKTFDEFMEWCEPYYEELCTKLEKNRIPIILSPLKQFKSGIPFNEIECKNGLELVGKMPSAHPKCVKPESLEKLTMRGWATTNKTLELMNPTKYPIEKNDHTFEIQYSLKGATLQSIAHDVDANSIHVELSNSVGGQMVISIPRDLIDAKMGNNNVDDVFFLLIDGEENMYGEKTTDNERIITIWFPRDVRDIEIIGTFWI